MIIPVEEVCAAGIACVPFVCSPLVGHVVDAVDIPKGVNVVHPPITRRKVKLRAIIFLVVGGVVVSGKWPSTIDFGDNKSPSTGNQSCPNQW